MSKELRIKVTERSQVTKMAQNLIEKFKIGNIDAKDVSVVKFYVAEDAKEEK